MISIEDIKETLIALADSKKSAHELTGGESKLDAFEKV
jgi:hypothetical protein